MLLPRLSTIPQQLFGGSRLCVGVVRRAHGLQVHRDNERNNPDTPFQFTSENLEKINVLLNNFPEGHKVSESGGSWMASKWLRAGMSTFYGNWSISNKKLNL